VPFYENPTFMESKAANLAEYNPLGRTGSLFAYTGAKSKKIKLELKYTLPHLMNFNMGVERFRRLINANSKEIQKGLFTNWDAGTAGTKGLDMESSISYEMEKSYWQMRLENEGMQGRMDTNKEFQDRARKGGMPDNNAYDQLLGGGLLESVSRDPTLHGRRTGRPISEMLNALERTEKHKAIDTLVFFTNILRTSVDNDARNPLFGPPIIRIVFGTMYRNVPCICRSYNLSFNDKEWGLDLETLTPRSLKVSLDLVEVRVGNFGEFIPNKIVSRDNLAGWESVINEPLSTDPGDL